MKKRHFLLACGLFLLLGGLLATFSLPRPAGAALLSTEVIVTPLVEAGGRLDWSHTLNLIAYDRLGTDGYYDVHYLSPEGANGPCLTCNHPTLPNKHMGNPAWHPSGYFLAIQVEKAEHDGTPESATPGLGINNDIWIISRDRSTATRITNVAEGMGVLHPHFSHDGTRLLWAERVADAANPSGTWAIRVLTFPGRNPLDLRSANLITYMPLGPAFYETHGFSPDDEKIIFTAHDALYTPNNSWMDVYSLELATGTLQRLTFSPDAWDEHAQYAPDGKTLTWISSRDCGCAMFPPTDLATELYRMNADGTQKIKLTALNSQIPAGDPPDIAADHSWGPTGDSLVLYIQKGEETRPLEGRLVRVDFSFAQRSD